MTGWGGLIGGWGLVFFGLIGGNLVMQTCNIVCSKPINPLCNSPIGLVYVAATLIGFVMVSVWFITHDKVK